MNKVYKVICDDMRLTIYRQPQLLLPSNTNHTSTALSRITVPIRITLSREITNRLKETPILQ